MTSQPYSLIQCLNFAQLLDGNQQSILPSLDVLFYPIEQETIRRSIARGREWTGDACSVRFQ
jgi:hypothetical protein